MVAIETDPQAAGDRSAGSSGVLGQGDAEQMLAHLAADLTALLGDIGKCRLAVPGALFDQCQLLRPDTPVYAALSAVLGGEVSGDATPGLTAIGAEDGAMPAGALQPDEDIPPAVLRLIPMLAAGPEALVEKLAEEMEHRFLAEGQVSAHTASWLETAFGIGISHARFMTLTDLNAMFRLQLEHFGYLPLWELVDTAVRGSAEELSLTTDNGTEYGWRDGSVHVTFQTFDYWANEGGGREVEAQAEGEGEGDGLAGAYADWSRELRRYTSTLAAHHVPVRFELPRGCVGRVGEHFLCEEIAAPPASGLLASVTEHGWPELGTVAITARTADGLRHYYPLTPRGLNDIHHALSALELAGEGVAYPGTIKISESTRRLRPVHFEA